MNEMPSKSIWPGNPLDIKPSARYSTQNPMTIERLKKWACQFLLPQSLKGGIRLHDEKTGKVTTITFCEVYTGKGPTDALNLKYGQIVIHYNSDDQFEVFE